MRCSTSPTATAATYIFVLRWSRFFPGNEQQQRDKEGKGAAGCRRVVRRRVGALAIKVAAAKTRVRVAQEAKEGAAAEQHEGVERLERHRASSKLPVPIAPLWPSA